MLHAAHQVFSTALHGLMKHLGIGEEHVRRADGIQELAQVEDQFALLLLIQTLNLRSGLQQRRSSKQIGLFECIENGILLPVRGDEAFIAFLRCNHRLGFLTASLEREARCGHHLRILLNKITIGGPGAVRVPDGIEPDLLQGTYHLGGIKRDQFAVRIGLPELVNEREPGIILTLLDVLDRCGHGWISLQCALNQLAPSLEGILFACYCICHRGSSFRWTQPWMADRVIDEKFSRPHQSCAISVTGENTVTLSENTTAWCQFQNDTMEMGQGGPCTSFPLLVKVETKDLISNHGELRHKALCLLMLW